MTTVQFQYRAIDRAGRETRGTVSAQSRDQAFRKVAESDLTPISIRAQREAGRAGLRRRVRLRDVAQFTYQLQVLIEARIPISEGLTGLARQEENPAFRHILLDIASQVESGHSIAAAMEPHRDALGDVYVETINAAEKSGTMARTLNHLCEALERMETSRRQVRGALLYPACVTATLVLASGFLVTHTIPRFASMFAARGVDLPLLTSLLAGVGEAVRSYWWACLLVVFGLAALGRWLARTRVRTVEAAIHRVPVMRAVLTALAVSRFTRVLALSLSAGLGLLDAMEMAKRAASRAMLAEEIERVCEGIRGGRQLADGLADATYLPSFARRMLAAGEQSGELSRMAEIVARHYEREASHQVKTLTTVMEPVLVVAITGVVLVVALAIFLPMWNMVQLMG